MKTRNKCKTSPRCSHNTNGRDLSKPCSISWVEDVKDPHAVSLGKRTSERKKRTSAENGRKADQIRARLTIYRHEDMSDHEFAFFKEWVTKIVPATAKNKRGDLSKIFRQTLYKQEPLENK